MPPSTAITDTTNDRMAWRKKAGVCLGATGMDMATTMHRSPGGVDPENPLGVPGLVTGGQEAPQIRGVPRVTARRPDRTVVFVGVTRDA